MKKNLGIRRAWRAGAGSLAAVSLALALNVSAQPFASPVGDWDVVQTGVRDGVAHLSFSPDGTFSMSEIIVPKHPVSDVRTSVDSRGTGGDDSRTGAIPTNAIVTSTNLYGAVLVADVPDYMQTNYTITVSYATNLDGSTVPVTNYPGAIWVHNGRPAGRWGYDLSGRLIGFFSEIGAITAISTNLIPIGVPTTCCCDTQTVVGSNGPVLVVTCLTNQPYLTNVEYIRITNGISFSGKVSLNMSDLTKSRLTIVAATPAGRVTFSGIVPTELPNVEGSWLGQKRQAGVLYNEFFSLENPDSLNTGYDLTNGEGPSYTFSGPVIVTRQKKAGFAVSIVRPRDPTLPFDANILVIRAVVGSIDLNRGRFSGRGLEGSDQSPASLTYKASLMPPATE